MAFEEFDDIEQERLVKQWLKDNWLTIFAGIVLGIGAIYGYNYWEASKQQKKYEAARKADEFNQVVQLGETEEARNLVGEMESSFGHNLFTIEARMALAKKALESDDTETAIQQYEKILEGKPERALAEMSRLRLARLKLAQGEYDQVDELLNQVRSEAYASMVEEIRGDLLQARGEAAAAADAYELALNSGEGYSGRNILEMKLADVRTAE